MEIRTALLCVHFIHLPPRSKNNPNLEFTHFLSSEMHRAHEKMAEVRFSKWFSADAWKRTPKDYKEGSARPFGLPSESFAFCGTFPLRLMLRAFNPHGKRKLTRRHGDTECDFQSGVLPQTPNAGQSQAIGWCSGHGVEPHSQIDLRNRQSPAAVMCEAGA